MREDLPSSFKLLQYQPHHRKWSKLCVGLPGDLCSINQNGTAGTRESPKMDAESIESIGFTSCGANMHSSNSGMFFNNCRVRICSPSSSLGLLPEMLRLVGTVDCQEGLKIEMGVCSVSSWCY